MKVLAITCDLYRDSIPAWEYLWYAAWPDCPYEVVYLTNSKPLSTDKQVYYVHGAENQFGRRFRKFYSTHWRENELVLLMMADYFVQNVNVELIERAKGQCLKSDVAHVRLRPMPHPQRAYRRNNRDFGLIDKRRAYALSLQPGLWFPKDLAKCCRDRESAWHVETHGSGRTKRIRGMFLSTRRPAIIHLNYYRKRKPFGLSWVRDNVPREFWPNAVEKAFGGEYGGE
jgi:hypothetical protein